MSEQNKTSYKISLSNGSIAVEAPTKKECISLFRTVSKTRLNENRPIDKGLV